jgi:hypothetical protein
VTSALSASDMPETASSFPELRFWMRCQVTFEAAGASSGANMPPTTGRSWKPRCAAVATVYQSLNGTRCAVVSAKLWTPLTRMSRVVPWSASQAAVHTSQSPLV